MEELQLASDENPKLADFAEELLDPTRSDYAGLKFERFMTETKNAACPGCGNVGLYEYIILDRTTGLMYCPECNQTADLKTMMRAWLGVHGRE